jgi:GAF domain-containing protein
MTREGAPIGVIVVSWREPGRIPERQITLLATFADQAVIAIENVRLFNETKESLERQTATAEILKVIAGSPSDVQPVFDAIVHSSLRLVPGSRVALGLVRDGLIQTAAAVDPADRNTERMTPFPLDRNSAAGVAVMECRVMHLPDTEKGAEEFPRTKQLSLQRGHKALLVVPLVRDGKGFGFLSATRRIAGLFTDHEIDLLRTFADQAVIAIENVRLFRELGARNRDVTEALEQQTATADILKVISSSPTDTQPVFEAIVQSGLKLFPNAAVLVTVSDGDQGRLAAIADADPLRAAQWKKVHQFPLTREYMHAVAILDRAVIDLPDAQAYEGGPLAAGVRTFLTTGNRAITIMPMLRADAVIGTISVVRLAPGPLTDKQIALLRTFADQAVIAIENVRLFNETKESLERQTATAEILKVISGSPTDTQPIFDAIVQSAARLCDAVYSASLRLDGGLIHLVAHHNWVGEALAVAQRLFPMPADYDHLTARAIRESRIVHLQDMQSDPKVPATSRELAIATGYRTLLIVPMLLEKRAIGAIAVAKAEGPFSEKQIELLMTFADQAVIAIQNVRLFNETKEALERQTATAEILNVIASSPSDVQPVFDAIAKSSIRLVGGNSCSVSRVEGNLLCLAALTSTDPIGDDLVRSFYPMPLDGPAPMLEAIRTGEVQLFRDVESDPRWTDSGLKVSRARGVRSIAYVPILREGAAIGAIHVASAEPGSITEQHVRLLRIFADQAVIAIENVRLFNETKEALERQTATAEILRVIASSPSDVQPVFDAIAASARRLLDGGAANVTRRAGDRLELAAYTSTSQTADELLRKLFPAPITGQGHLGKAILTRAPVRVSDIQTDEAYSESFRVMAGERGLRSVVSVPMLREGEAIGVISVNRPVAGDFSDHQTNLLKTFADQAVIAIENVRLFNETKEALERQTATAEILRVISSSPTDAQPVFEAIVQSGLRLFSGAGVGIAIVEGGELRVVAATGGLSAAARGIHLPISRESASGMAIVERRVVNIRDTEAPDVPPHARDNGRKLGIRSMTQAPMFRDGEPVGVIGVTLKDPGSLDDKQLALLKTFADQAVIAIENVRLFKELQSRTEALTRSVGQMTALSEVGQAISSTLDLETVLQTIVSRAVQLTGLDAGSIYEYDEQAEVYRLQAAEKMPPELVEAVRRTPIRKGDGATGRTAETLEPVQVPDIEDDSYRGSRKDNLKRTGYRAVLAVPLLREDHLLGALQVFRRAPGPFAPEIVELLKTFATQSAMAIQNARLFREIAEKGKQLEEASQHKSNFLASMSHELRTPLNAILGFNEMILDEIYGPVAPDVRSPLEEMQASGKHLLRLINNVLDLAKIEAGRMELSLQDYSVHDTVASVHSTLRSIAAEKGLEFLATVPNDMPLAHGDGGRIAQCLMNLAGNSLKFTKAGKVEISVETRGELLIYRVTDTGIGIPPDKIDSLFTEFKQTDATIASEYGGTGLGLSISKKFIEMHGGRIWIESELGKGSAFIFEVPLRAKAT